MDLEEHLFRRESGRIVAALTRIFGVHNLALAEDVAQDAFCRAIEIWGTRGIPDNPAAWLMTTARNRAIDVIRRERTARTFAPEFARFVDAEWAAGSVPAALSEAFAAPTIRDGQLRMMFSCCHPRLSEDVQVALVLNILCGFGANEIASAFLTGRAAIEKRLTRGKRVLAGSRRLFDLSDAEFVPRLSAVRRALYLLFNEGYHGASGASAIRSDLCTEALRLTALLADSPPAASPETDALAALMSLHAARLPARVDACGDLHGLFDQDRSKWDGPLVEQGLALLERSASGPAVSAYHVEAAIAAAHAGAPSADRTDWAPHRLALRPPPRHRALACRRAQPRDCARRARRPGSRHGGARRDRRPRTPREVPVLSGGDGRTGVPPREQRGRGYTLRTGAHTGANRRRAPLPPEAAGCRVQPLSLLSSSSACRISVNARSKTAGRLRLTLEHAGRTRASWKESVMRTITPFLWFDTQAEEAMTFYTSVFERSKILSVNRAGDRVMSVQFELEGQKFTALNGGPAFQFTEAVSFFIGCESQKDVDELWAKLTAGGGLPGRCGWLKDRFGVSWQVVPTALARMLSNSDPARVQRVVSVMLTMQKLDVAALQAVYDAQ